MTGMDAVLKEIKDRLQALEDADRTAKLENSSISDTTLTILRDGEPVSEWGVHPDGQVGTRALGGDAPPQPTPARIIPVVGGFRVVWDGGFVNGQSTPLNLKQVDIHVDLNEQFNVSNLTRDDTITRLGGGVKEFSSTEYVLHYVRLVAVSESGLESVPSAQVAALPMRAGSADIAANAVGSAQLSAGAVIPSASATGTTGNLIPDSGFADAEWRIRRTNEQSGASWDIVAGTPSTSIQQSGYYARCAPSVADPDTGLDEQSMWLLPPPGVVANPGERFYLGVWAAKTTGAGGRWAPQAVFLDADGRQMDVSTTAVSLFRQIEDLPDAGLGNYQMFDSTITIPDTASALGIRVMRDDNESGNTTGSGYLMIERAELRSIMTRSDPGRNRVETGPNGINIISGSDGRSLGGIDEQGTATLTALTVSGGVTIGGNDLDTLLDAKALGEILRTSVPNPTAGTATVAQLLDTGFTARPGRRYRIFVTPAIVRLSGSMGYRLRWTIDGSPPTAGSAELYYCAAGLTQTVGVDLPFDIKGWSTTPVQVRILVEMISWDGVNGYLDSTDTKNGRKISLVVYDEGTDLGETPTGSQRFTTVWYCAWSKQAAAVTGWQPANDNQQLWQGRTGGYGDDFSVFGFNTAAIRSALAGATIVSGEMYLFCNWSEVAAGAYARIRTSARDTMPAGTDPYPTVSGTRILAHFALGEGRWIPLPADILAELKSGVTRSFALDARDVAPNPEDHGGWDGAAKPNEPVIRINYQK